MELNEILLTFHDEYSVYGRWVSLTCTLSPTTPCPIRLTPILVPNFQSTSLHIISTIIYIDDTKWTFIPDHLCIIIAQQPDHHDTHIFGDGQVLEGDYERARAVIEHVWKELSQQRENNEEQLVFIRIGYSRIVRGLCSQTNVRSRIVSDGEFYRDTITL